MLKFTSMIDKCNGKSTIIFSRKAQELFSWHDLEPYAKIEHRQILFIDHESYYIPIYWDGVTETEKWDKVSHKEFEAWCRDCANDEVNRRLNYE